MKTVILILAICVLSNQVSVTKRRPDREHDGFVGPVKKVFVSWTPISGWTYPADSKCRQLTDEYDQSGRTNRRAYIYSGDARVPAGFMYYGPDGKIYERASYTDYEFNSTDDWVKRKVTTEVTVNRRRVSMEYREIEYYPDNR